MKRNKTMVYVTLECEFCEQKFERYIKKVGKRNFCSKDCVDKHRTKSINPEGYHRKWNAKHLSEYNRKHNQSRMTDEVRNKIRLSKLGTGKKDSYEKYFGRHTHRVIAEKMLGRKLRKGEVVHHIDGNKRNNDASNLMVFKNQSEHVKWHLANDSRYQKKGGEV